MDNKNKILIIDDDNRNIFALSAVLKSKGFEVISASQMEEGFQLLKNGDGIGIILIDMMMPGMDGYEAIPKLKADKQLSHIPVIAVTAQAMAGDREKSIAAGADEYISKPVDVDLLMEALQKHLK